MKNAKLWYIIADGKQSAICRARRAERLQHDLKLCFDGVASRSSNLAGARL